MTIDIIAGCLLGIFSGVALAIDCILKLRKRPTHFKGSNNK